MGRLPFDQIDVLVVGELGKNYSGAGMDPNVIGRLMVETQTDFDRPVVTRLVVLDASDETHGNIVGVGFADLTTERLVAKLDPVPFRINTLTSCCLERTRIPITLPTDRDVFRPRSTPAGASTRRGADGRDPEHAGAEHALGLPGLGGEVSDHPHLTLETESGRIPFSADGSLDQESLSPTASAARRSGEKHA